MTKEEAAEILLGSSKEWIAKNDERQLGEVLWDQPIGPALRHSPRYLEACELLGLEPCTTEVLAQALFERVVTEMQERIFEKAMKRLKKVERLDQTTVDLITGSLMDDK